MSDPSSNTGGEARRWDWRSRYRTWQANRKTFESPENYLGPEPASPAPAADATPKKTSDGAKD
jgi:hypothetical protein